MKNLNYFLLYAALVIFSFSNTGCKSDDGGGGPSLAQQQLDKLSGKVWTVESVTRDNVNITNNYEGFTLAFSGTVNAAGTNVNGTYNTSNGILIFKDTGTWAFGADVEETIIKDGDLTMGYEVGAFLTLAFTFNGEGLSGGRTKGLNGQYVFTLK